MGGDGLLSNILTPVLNLLFGEYEIIPDMAALPPLPDPPEPEPRSEEEKEADRLRRVQARKTGGNPNVVTTPLGVVDDPETFRPSLLGK